MDNFFICGKDASKLQQLQHELKSQFCITDLKEVSHYLGIDVDVNANKSTITLCQTTYIKNILSQFNTLDSQPVFTLIEPGIKNIITPSEDQANTETIT